MRGSDQPRGAGPLSGRSSTTGAAIAMRPPLLLEGRQALCSNSASGGRGATRCCTATGDRRGNCCSPGGSSRKAVCGRPPHGPAASSRRPVCWSCRRTGLGTLRAGSPAAERMGAGVSIHSDRPRPPRRQDPQPHTTDQHAARTTPARHHHSPWRLQHARPPLSASSSTLAARTVAQRGDLPEHGHWTATIVASGVPPPLLQGAGRSSFPGGRRPTQQRRHGRRSVASPGSIPACTRKLVPLGGVQIFLVCRGTIKSEERDLVQQTATVNHVI